MQQFITKKSFCVGAPPCDNAKGISEFFKEQENLLLNNYLNSNEYQEYLKKGYQILNIYFDLEFAGSYDCHYNFVLEIGETEEDFAKRKLLKKNKKKS